ncbi:hypothetical protein PVAP13_9NG424314 [Panicum virgatum]|uniref:Uncharacterized protein n=1 Tax=Panicum virgatum TaxID=38727 RepID=A0A8T0MPW6_PANVG|nr:hypothetical protein PVAP13_9NG424314 [Panicum virgatum]
MALHGSGRRRYGHRAQRLAAMALRIAGRRRRSAQCHGRARGRQKRGRKLCAVPLELCEQLGSAPSRSLPTPGLELTHGPDDASGAGPQRTRGGSRGWWRGPVARVVGGGRVGERRRTEAAATRRRTEEREWLSSSPPLSSRALPAAPAPPPPRHAAPHRAAPPPPRRLPPPWPPAAPRRPLVMLPARSRRQRRRGPPGRRGEPAEPAWRPTATLDRTWQSTKAVNAGQRRFGPQVTHLNRSWI